MKVEFISYTKKSGEPENGLYKILEYLNGKTFELDKNEIWFLKDFE